MKPQVNKEIYRSKDYMSVGRFMSYHHQIKILMSLPECDSFCEIGKGNGITSALMQNFAYNITCVDFDADLKPDIVCSIFELDKIDKKFDVVAAFEVLEHLPFDKFDEALENMALISNKYIVLSLPYSGITLKIELYLSKYGERFMRFIKRIPLCWKKHHFDGQHYWELGKKGFSVKRIKSVLKKHFILQSVQFFGYNHSQIFFICEKK